MDFSSNSRDRVPQGNGPVVPPVAPQTYESIPTVAPAAPGALPNMFDTPLPELLVIDQEMLSSFERVLARDNARAAKLARKKSLRENLAAMPPSTQPTLEGLDMEEAGPSKEETRKSMALLAMRHDAPEIERVLCSFPVFGAQVPVKADDLDGLTKDGTVPEMLLDLREMGLVEPQEGGWQLTELGTATVRGFMLDTNMEVSGQVLDAQAAALTARMISDESAIPAFLECAKYLLAHGQLESESGHPTRWATALRAIRNASVVDLERPGSLLQGGLKSEELRALGRLASVSPLSEGNMPPEIHAWSVVMACRESIQTKLAGDADRLKEVLLDPQTYADLSRQMVGVKAMSHCAWVALTNDARPAERESLAFDLAKAVTGVADQGEMKGGDFALLTPDHREAILLALAEQDSPDFALGGTLDQARRRLAMLVPTLEDEYPSTGSRVAAGVRILAAHTAASGLSEARLEQETRTVFQNVEDGREICSDIVQAARNFVSGSLNGMGGVAHLAKAIRGEEQKHTTANKATPEDELKHALRESPEMVSSAEWVAVAEKFASFQSFQEAQEYRYAMMELRGRQRGNPKEADSERYNRAQRDALGRMLTHATTLMSLLTHQDQGMSIPPAEKAEYKAMTEAVLRERIEGDGGRFGLARIPWDENEREQTFRRLVEFSGLKVDLPEEMDMVRRNLMTLMRGYVAPGSKSEPVDAPQREMLENYIGVGNVAPNLTEADAADALGFVQVITAAKKSGLLCTYGEDGVTVEEALAAHSRPASEDED